MCVYKYCVVLCFLVQNPESNAQSNNEKWKKKKDFLAYVRFTSYFVLFIVCCVVLVYVYKKIIINYKLEIILFYYLILSSRFLLRLQNFRCGFEIKKTNNENDNEYL